MYDGEEALVDLRCDNGLMKTMVDRFGADITTLAYDENSFKMTAYVSVSPTFFGGYLDLAAKFRYLHQRV